MIVTPTTDGLPVAGSSFTVLHFTDPARADTVYIEQSDDAWYSLASFRSVVVMRSTLR